MGRVTLILLGIFVNCAVINGNDEFYCKVEYSQYKICRKCPRLDEYCEKDAAADNECKCDNIEMPNSQTCKYL